jgi:hypothetical protein
MRIRTNVKAGCNCSDGCRCLDYMTHEGCMEACQS